MAERIADYCEAVINVTEMCKTGLKCCVSRDSYGNADVKPLNFITRDRNTNTSTSASTVSAVTEHQSHTSSNAANYGSLSTSTTTTPPPPKITTNAKPCQGECVNGLLALFCDDIDSTAFCAGEDSCCITNPATNSAPLATSTHYNIYTSPRTPSTAHPSTYSTTVPSTSIQNSAPSNLPKCPGFCLLNLMAAFCERPAVIMTHTSTCKKGSICCDNTKSGTTHKPRPHTTVTTTTTTSTTTLPPPPDPRPECPGSCIVSYLSFTCFRK